jgi:anti-sigma factor RsiW
LEFIKYSPRVKSVRASPPFEIYHVLSSRASETSGNFVNASRPAGSIWYGMVTLIMHENSHISDERLLMELDGELAAHDQAMVRSSLAACWECRARRNEIEAAITDFVRFHLQEFDGKLPPSAGPLALLRARMAQISESESGARRFWVPRPPKWKIAAAVLGLIALFSCAAYRTGRFPGFRSAPTEVYLPDSTLTPGAATLASQQAVCAQANVKNKAVSAALQEQVFAEYGIRRPEPRAYEVDHLVTPALGGADDVRNLWPHSYSAVWNARVKDDLEDRLRDMVCDGTLDLRQAQREIAQNWIDAYKRYFHTDKPIAAHRTELRPNY